MSLKNNPLINCPETKYGAIPFDKIKLEHFLPAIDYAIEKADNTMEVIKNNPAPPTFDNTALPMETGTELLDTVANIYFNLMGAESDNTFKELAQQNITKNSQLLRIKFS